MATLVDSNRTVEHSFTCNTCHIAFRSGELQRAHMQSDWHRYNLKRRIASLPSLSSEVYSEKILSNKASESNVTSKLTFQRHCSYCQKTYYSENAYKNHLLGQRHRLFEMKIANSGKSALLEENVSDAVDKNSIAVLSTSSQIANASCDSSDEVTALAACVKSVNLCGGADQNVLDVDINRPQKPDSRSDMPANKKFNSNNSFLGEVAKIDMQTSLTSCLFCDMLSTNLDANVEHMTHEHSLFVPEADYLVSLEDLLRYLYQKVYNLHECLYCGKRKVSVEACQRHMIDVGHCMIAFSTESEKLEIGQFYDFSSTYSDIDDDVDFIIPDMTDDNVANEDIIKDISLRDDPTSSDMGVVATVNVKNDNDDDRISDASWETASTLSSVPTEEIGAIPIEMDFSRLRKNPHHSHSQHRRHKNLDGWHSHASHAPKAVYYDDIELHLSNGKSIGHRKWRRIWRQRLPYNGGVINLNTSFSHLDTDLINEGDELGSNTLGYDDLNGCIQDPDSLGYYDANILNSSSYTSSLSCYQRQVRHNKNPSNSGKRNQRNQFFKQHSPPPRRQHFSNFVISTSPYPSSSSSSSSHLYTNNSTFHGLSTIHPNKRRQVVQDYHRGRRLERCEQRKVQSLVESRANYQKHFREPFLQ